jgi:hypothetical protein
MIEGSTGGGGDIGASKKMGNKMTTQLSCVVISRGEGRRTGVGGPGRVGRGVEGGPSRQEAGRVR